MVASRGNAKIDRVREFRPVTSNRLRLMVHRTQIDVSRIWEVEVYGPAKEGN